MAALIVLTATLIVSCSGRIPEPEPEEYTTYTVTFMNGDSVEKTVTVNAGDTVSELTPAEKEGYTFVCWNSDGKKYDFASSVNEDIALQAVWKDNSKVQVTVIEYDGREKIEFLDKNSEYTAPAAPERGGYTFQGWKADGTEKTYSADEGGITLSSDITLVADWKKNARLTVTFKNGDEIVKELSVDWGTEIEAPVVTAPEGQEFDYWENGNGDEEEQGAHLIVESSATWTAVFKTKENVYVTFESDDGVFFGTRLAECGTALSSEPDTPLKNGYRFTGWYVKNTDNKFDFSETLTKDVTCVAHWEEIKDGDRDKAVLILKSTDKDYNEFEKKYIFPKGTEFDIGLYLDLDDCSDSSGRAYIDGWLKDGETEPGGTYIKLTEDSVTYTAVWKKYTNTVSFDRNGGLFTATGTTDAEKSVPSQDVEVDGNATKPDGTMTYDGDDTVTFLCWSLDGVTEYDFNTPVTEDIELMALWISDAEYTVTFDYGYDNLKKEVKVTRCNKVPEFDRPERAGYIFDDWYYMDGDSEEYFSFEKKKIRDNLTVYAKWFENPECTVSYRTVDNYTIYEETIASGTRTAGIEPPQREGYTFTGWYEFDAESFEIGEIVISDEKFDFSSPVYYDVVLAALYSKNED